MPLHEMRKRKKFRKPGSGRRRGSYSFISVSLSELNRIFKSEAAIVISRKWAAQNNIHVTSFIATSQNLASVSTPVDFKEINLDAEEGTI